MNLFDYVNLNQREETFKLTLFFLWINRTFAE